MAAQMKIDQTGLSAGVAGRARLDGKADGSVVTLTSVSPGLTNTFRLLAVPPDDDEALDSLVPTGGGTTPVWTFTPKEGVRGAYRIELITDLGQSNESRQMRVFGIPGWRHNLVPPALNEGGDPAASHILQGAEYNAAVAGTDRNVDRDGASSLDGWQRALVDAFAAIERGNYTQVNVPSGAQAYIPDGQEMLFVRGVRGDFRGDLREVGGSAGGSSELDYDYELFWNDSAFNGPAGNSDTTNILDFTAEVGRINKYSLAFDNIVATLPEAGPRDYNRRIAFYEVGGTIAGSLNVTASGSDVIVTPDNGPSGDTVVQYDQPFGFVEFQNYGAIWVETRRHPPVAAAGAAIKEWSDEFVASGDLVPNVVNRYDGNIVGMTLTFPADPTHGMEIEVVNTGGPSADEEVTFASGNGNTLRISTASLTENWAISNPGFTAKWKWDNTHGWWQLIRFFLAEVG